jgi:hypothetical protein
MSDQTPDEWLAGINRSKTRRSNRGLRKLGITDPPEPAVGAKKKIPGDQGARGPPDLGRV